MEYEDNKRGLILNRERAKQIIDYSGIKFDRKISPTDIDGLVEYDNKAYVLMEFKYRGNTMPYGQSLAMTRMIDDFTAQGKESAFLVCEHNVTNPEEDIDAAKATVREVYYEGKWGKPNTGFSNVKTFVDQFIRHVKNKG